MDYKLIPELLEKIAKYDTAQVVVLVFFYKGYHGVIEDTKNRIDKKVINKCIDRTISRFYANNPFFEGYDRGVEHHDEYLSCRIDKKAP